MHRLLLFIRLAYRVEFVALRILQVRMLLTMVTAALDDTLMRKTSLVDRSGRTMEQ